MTHAIAAITLACALIAPWLTIGTLLSRQSRAHARERNLLVNQILHLAGRTWQEPPAHREPAAVEPRLTISRPEQMPDDYDWETE